MLFINRILATLMLVASGYYGSLWYKKAFVGVQRPSQVVKTESPVRFFHQESEALLKAKELNLPIFVDFAAEWCEACHVIEKTVFTDPEVASVLNSKFIPLQIDVTESNEINDKILEKYGVLSLPTLVFIDRSGNILAKPRVHGVISPKAFLEILNSF